MRPSEKAKKRLIVTVLGTLCVVLIIVIYSRLREEKKEMAMKPATPVVTDEITPEISTTAHTTTLIPTSTPAPEISVQPVEATATIPPSKDTGDSEGTEQSIQAEVIKPPEPSEEIKADPTKKPNGVKVTKNDSNEKKDSKKESGAKKDSGTSSSSKPKSGDMEDGKIFVPGFGWVEDNGGGTEQEEVGSDGDINKQVGTMK